MPSRFSSWFRLRIPRKMKAAVEYAQVYNTPEESLAGMQTNREALYALLWDLYANELYTKRADNVDRYIEYRKRHGLYKNIRPVYNVVPLMVDFYAANVWPGVWAEPQTAIPEGLRRALPLNEDCPEDIAAAIFQLVQWSNFATRSKVLLRRCAALGNTLVEVVDNVESGKVGYDILWPSQVAEMHLDTFGNVKAYALEYSTVDNNNIPYRYRKEVDEQWIIEYADEKVASRIPNVYGFVPAVWFKHIDMGGTWGIPAVRNTIGMINELNNLVSHIHDRGIHKALRQPRILWTDGIITGAFDTTDTDETEDEMAAASGADADLNMAASEYDVLKGPAGGKTDSIVTDMPLDEAMQFVDKLMKGIEQHNPEIAFWQALRGMTSLTGPAILRVSGDVTERVLEPANNYDTGLKRLLQMGMSIAGLGYAENKGGWSLRTAQQKKFANFTLDSFKADLLEFSIQPRLLITPTEIERLEAQQKRASYANSIKDNISEDEYFRILLYSEDQIRQIRRERTTQDVIPSEDEQE